MYFFVHHDIIFHKRHFFPIGMEETLKNGRGFLRAAEVDALCGVHQFDGKDMKSKKGTAKSMRTLIASDSYPEIQFGVKLSAGNIGSSEHVFTAPYFTTFLLRRLLRAYDEGQAPMLNNPER